MPSRPDHTALKATISTAHANPRSQKLALTHKRASNGDSKLPINGNLLREKFDDPDFDKKEEEKTLRSQEREAKESVRRELETECAEVEDEADEAAEFENDNEELDEYEEEITDYDEDEFFNR